MNGTPVYPDFTSSVWERATTLANKPINTHSIHVPKFCQAYLSCLGGRYNVKFSDVDLACLVVIFSDHGEEEEQMPLVTKREFDLFLLRFGPPIKSLEKIRNVLINGKVWFHGNQGRESSERLLREKPKEGLFLLRYSGTPGAFTVDYIKNKKICRFTNIRNDPKGGVEVVVGKQQRQTYKYSTMDTFITKNAHIFQRPALNTRSHFQWLKLRIPSATSGGNDADEEADNSKVRGGTPAQRLAAAIKHSLTTDKTKLTLRGLGLGPQIPSQIFTMKFLRNLNLSKNSLTTVSARLGDLDALEILCLNENQIKSIPPGLFPRLQNLTHFQCAENQLMALPDDFCKMKRVANVDISGNNLTKLPPNLSNLVQIVFFDLSNNSLEVLPMCPKLPNIEEFLATGNKIREIHPSWAKLPNLIVFDLSKNRIKTIPPAILNRISVDSKFSIDIKNNLLSPQEQKKLNDLLAKSKTPTISKPSGTSTDIIRLFNVKPENMVPDRRAQPPPARSGRMPAPAGKHGSAYPSLWIETMGYWHEEHDQNNQRGYAMGDLALYEHINKADYNKYFYGNVHVNVIGDEKQLGPICVSIMKQPDANKDMSAGDAIVLTQMPGTASRVGYRVLLRSKTGDRDLQIPADWVKRRKRQNYARTDTLLLGLKKMLKPGFSTRNLYPIRDPASHEVFSELERKLISRCSKFGVIYGKDGQDENEMYNNREGSPAFEEFLDCMAKKINMLGWTKYRGDLSAKSDIKSRYVVWMGHEVMFHVSTYIPYMEQTDAINQQWERKRFLGNDIVLIVFYEGKTPVNPDTFVSNFNHVFVMVQPLMLNGKRHYRLHICYKKGVAKSKPVLPKDATFTKEEIKPFLLTKLINSERYAMSAMQFRRANEKVRSELFGDLQDRFPKKSRSSKDQDNGYYSFDPSKRPPGK